MKSFLDFEEKNVEKAVLKACAELNVSREKLKYDIISHGSSGIFGLVGTKKALIRVFVPDLTNKKLQSEIFDGASAPATKENLTQNVSASIQNDVSALVDEAFGQIKSPDHDKKIAPSPKRAKPIGIKHTPRSPRSSTSKTKPYPERQEKAKPAKEKSAPNADLKKTDDNESEQQQITAPVELTPPDDSNTEPKNNEAAAAVALSLARKILDAIAVDAELSVDSSSSNVCRINVKVSEPGVLIGKKGQTLDAIQYLVDKVVNKQCGKGNHIVFDVEGYVESRKTELTDLASRLATKAMNTGKPATMTRMNAHDRRIVHVSLKGNPSVRTQSVGDGYYRKLIIFPKKKASKQSSKDSPKE